MRERHFEPVSDVLHRVVRGLDIEEQLRAHAVEPAWPRAVGPRVAASTRPAQLRAGVLLVEARSAAWMNEAALLREQIRESLNREMGGHFVRELRFRLGGGFPPLVPVPVPPRPAASEAEIAEVVAELIASAGIEGAQLVARARALQRHAAPKGPKPPEK
jgi:hypothetical protein